MNEQSSMPIFAIPRDYIMNFSDAGNPVFTPKRTKFKGYMRDKSWIKRHKN